MLSAAAKSATDPNDTAGPLDMRRVTLERGQAAGTWLFVVRTWDSWNEPAAADGFHVQLDTRSDRDVDYVLSLLYVGGDLICILGDVNSPDTLATRPATKPDAKTARCSFPKRGMRISKTVRWSVVSVSGARRDFAPDVGVVRGL